MKQLACVLSILVGFNIFAFSMGAQEPAAQRLPAVPSLAQRASTEGSVRVIVGVRSTFVPEGGLSSAQAVDQRTVIADAQSVVIDRLLGLPVNGVRRFESIPFFAAQVGRAALDRLAAMPEVISIQEDVAERPTLAESAVLIGAPAAWQGGTTASGVPISGYTGNGWTVAVLDTGVDSTHPFLAGKVVSEACYSNADGMGGQTSTCPGGIPSSTATGSGTPCSSAFEGCEHGTHVAGIAAGRQYSGGPAMSGIGKNASIISVKVFTGFDAAMCGGGPCALSYVSDQIAGLQRVYDLRGTYRIAAVNMSLGGSAFTDQVNCDSSNAARKAMIDQLRSVGIATVISSGNNGMPSAMSAPACISSAVSVGSVDDGSFGTVANAVSTFSNGAPFLNLLAPGRWITSSVPGGFAEFSGTSMAAPHVAGAWAVLKERKPTASVSEILGALLSTGVAIPDPRPSGSAHPRISLAAAVASIAVDFMSMDAPGPSATLAEPFSISGWAINMSAASGTGVDTVHVWAYPASGAGIFVGTADYGLARPDVGNVYGSQFTNSGWQVTGRGIPPGVYTISAYARSTTTGQFTQLVSAGSVTILASPQLWIDGPTNNSIVQQPFAISGWGVDFATASGTGLDAVQVYAYPNPGSGAPPTFLGSAVYGISRPDVGAAMASQFTNSGFSLTVSTLTGGRYRFVVYGHSTVTNSFSVVKQVDVTVSQPVMNVDTPANGSTQTGSFSVAGWAIDRAATDNAGIDSVHVWAYPDPGSGAAPIVIGAATYGFARSDVAAVYGAQFVNSGFSINVPALPRGHTYRITLYPHSAVTSTFSVRTFDVVVP